MARYESSERALAARRLRVKLQAFAATSRCATHGEASAAHASQRISSFPGVSSMPSPPLRRDSSARSALGDNPFASFYDSRRKLGVSDPDGETSDPSSSITRAYIVPDALLAQSRRDDAGELGAARDDRISFARSLATHGRDVATQTTGMFQIQQPLNMGGADGHAVRPRVRAVQRIAVRAVAWLRRRWRHSLSD